MGKTKQVLIVRKDLNMRKGKLAAQCCHASNAVLLDMILNNIVWKEAHPDGWMKAGYIWKSSELCIKEWLTGSFTKICVSVNSKAELFELYDKALSIGIPCSFIVDSGLTEFNNVKTETCIAIGPWWSDEIDKITGHLPLL